VEDHPQQILRRRSPQYPRGLKDTELSSEQIERLFNHVGSTNKAIESIDKTLKEMDGRLEEGDEQFKQVAKDMADVKMECTRRAAVCPACLPGGQSTPITKAKTEIENGALPKRYILTALAALGLSIWGLIQILAKILGVDMKWPF
jgi:hypothetical protein